MSLLRRKRAGERMSDAAADAAAHAHEPGDSQVAADERSEGAPETTVEGERGIASVNRARSMQSRVSNVLAVGLMSVLGLGLLTWYYAKTASRQARAEQSAQAASKAKAQGEMPLPALGPITPPMWSRAPQDESPSGAGTADQSALEQVLGPPPEAPPRSIGVAWSAAGSYAPVHGAPGGEPEKTPAQLAFERRLSGPVFVGRGDAPGTSGGPPGPTPLYMDPGAESGGPPGVTGAWVPPGSDGRDAPSLAVASRDDGRLSAYLQPSTTPAVQARVLPTQRMLLPKGAFVDCTLETAIDSTLPGMTTCVTAGDTFGVDGQVVLLERGTKLVGETQGQVRQGAARVFVLWTEARTPTGVVVPLASPATDALGRSGLPGEVNRHFWERFGAAILISVIDGAVQAAVQSDGGGTVIYNPSTSENIMTEVLKSTVNIPPTVVVANGERIQVLVARDLDFRSVYELRPVPAAAGTTNPAPTGSEPSTHEPSGRE